MSPAIFEQAGIVIAVILCSIAVKLIDDFLDNDRDSLAGCYNFSKILGNGIIVYGMLSLSIAASINASVSIPLFLVSYSIGMFTDFKKTFISGLSGLQESLLVFSLGVILWGWQCMLFSLFFVFSLQLFDDYLDIYTDQLAGYRNLAHRIGKVECLLLSILTLCTAWWINEHLFPAVLLGTAIVYSALLYYQRGR